MQQDRIALYAQSTAKNPRKQHYRTFLFPNPDFIPWNLTLFITHLRLMPNEYYVTKSSNRNAMESTKIRIAVQNTDLFVITFTPDLLSFSWKVIPSSGITFDQFENHQLFTFLKNSSPEGDKHPIIWFTKYIYDKRRIHGEFSDEIETVLKSLNIFLPARKLTRLQNSETIESLLHNLSGSLKIFTTDAQNKKLVTFESETLLGFSWVCPWASKILEISDVAELDASFWALKPYVFSIFTSIIANKGIPIVLEVSLVENSQHYEKIFEHLDELQLNKPKQILCDMGKGLDKALRLHQIQKKICHRHIIEAVGASSDPGIFVKRILEHSLTLEELTREVKIIESELEILTPDMNLNGYKILQKMMKLEENIPTIVTDTASGKNIFAETSNYSIEKWALFHREKLGSCSNHVEGDHGKINRKIVGKHSFRKGLGIILLFIQERKKNFEKMLADSRSLEYYALKMKHSVMFLPETIGNPCRIAGYYNSLLCTKSFMCHHLPSKVKLDANCPLIIEAKLALSLKYSGLDVQKIFMNFSGAEIPIENKKNFESDSIVEPDELDTEDDDHDIAFQCSMTSYIRSTKFGGRPLDLFCLEIAREGKQQGIPFLFGFTVAMNVVCRNLMDMKDDCAERWFATVRVGAREEFMDYLKIKK